MTTASQRLAIGGYGEHVAARHLIELGMVLLDSNWRCSAGELDLVLRDGRVLVICEVKTRTDASCGHPLEAVTAQKVERLHRLAALWMEERLIRPPEIRIDMVGVLRARRGGATIEHVKGIG